MKGKQGGPAPVVAIVGRPNVGKSTLFNRLVGRRQAIVDNHPGVTRDRHYGTVEWAGRRFTVVDTGGFDVFSVENMASLIRGQVQEALKEASLVLFVVDAVEGLTPLDDELARIIRSRDGTKALVLANKVDHPGRGALALDFFQLGVDHVYPVSAEHGLGLDEVLDVVVDVIPCEKLSGEEETALRVAIVGRPNVGKSSLVNCVLGEKRVVVDSRPGTTRDAIDTAFFRDGRQWMLIDTAGIRRRGKIDRRLEKYSVLRAVRSISRADVCVLVLDAGEMVTDQDAHIGGAVQEAHRGCVVVVNKWDLVDCGPGAGDEYKRKIGEALKHLAWAPVVFTSALTGRGVRKLLDAVEGAYDQFGRTIATPELNSFFRRVVRSYKPPSFKGKPISLGYITQERAKPPTFAVLVNAPARIHFSYRRYLENRIREEFGFEGTAVVLKFKAKGTRARPRRRKTS